MINIDKLNDHELVDLKNAIERELKRRADGPKVTTYYVVSCITDAQHFTDLDCALRCLKRVTEDLIEWVRLSMMTSIPVVNWPGLQPAMPGTSVPVAGFMPKIRRRIKMKASRMTGRGLKNGGNRPVLTETWKKRVPLFWQRWNALTAPRNPAGRTCNGYFAGVN